MMNKEEILEAIESLSHSQGSYGRLLEQLEIDGVGEEFLQHLEDMEFDDIVDLVMYLEE